MLRKKARQFFIAILLMAGYLVYNSNSVDRLIGLSGNPVSDLKSEDYELDMTKNSIETVTKKVEASGKVTIERKKKENRDYFQSVRPGTYRLDDQRDYVFIDGGYYLYREDNTYMVNGEEIFFIDNSRFRRGEGENTVANMKRVADRHDSSLARMKNVTDRQASSVDNNEYQPKTGLEAMSPKNMINMMESLKKSQSRIGERNKELEKLMEEMK